MKPKNMYWQNGVFSLAALSLVLGLLLMSISGCSVVKAANQPGKKNLSVLNTGTPRSYVIAELGTPTLSEEKNGRKVDIFSFTQGYSKGAKVGRAFFHGAADVLTIGLWEILGTPIETFADGKDIQVEITYDKQDRVQLVKALKE